MKYTFLIVSALFLLTGCASKTEQPTQNMRTVLVWLDDNCSKAKSTVLLDDAKSLRALESIDEVFAAYSTPHQPMKPFSDFDVGITFVFNAKQEALQDKKLLKFIDTHIRTCATKLEIFDY